MVDSCLTQGVCLEYSCLAENLNWTADGRKLLKAVSSLFLPCKYFFFGFAVCFSHWCWSCCHVTVYMWVCANVFPPYHKHAAHYWIFSPLKGFTILAQNKNIHSRWEYNLRGAQASVVLVLVLDQINAECFGGKDVEHKTMEFVRNVLEVKELEWYSL